MNTNAARPPRRRAGVAVRSEVAIVRTVVLRLVGGSMEGQWREVEQAHQLDLHRFQGPSTVMVPTGSVEWNGDRCAEVYVPKDKLDLWRAEHDVEER